MRHKKESSNRGSRSYKYRGFSIVYDEGFWFSSAPNIEWTDLAETIKEAKWAIDDFYNGVWETQ